MKFIKKTLTIREDQENWLKKNTSVNVSGFLQERLDKLIEEKVNTSL